MARTSLQNTMLAFALLFALAECRMEAQFEKCCGLGTKWASEGLRCEKFVGPVSGVSQVEQSLCLELVDICCVKAYHEIQCERGKEDARDGKACVIGSSAKSRPHSGDYHRDCCEACKLGILTGALGEGCAFKNFNFGAPWDPSFLQCCNEASPSTTPDFTSDFTNSTDTTDSDATSPSVSMSSSTSLSPSSSFSPSASTSSDSTSSTSDSTSTSSDSTSSTSDSTSSATSYSPSIPTPKLDDICKLMEGMLCSDICIPTPGSFYCDCPPGSILLEDGKTCRRNSTNDRCETSPCEQNCRDDGTSVTCSCRPGFTLNSDKRSCRPSDEKTDTTLPMNEDNELAGRCPSGYKFNAAAEVCDDVNECEEESYSCPAGKRCRNTIGSYLCLENLRPSMKPHYKSCPPGFQWDYGRNKCTDIDECAILDHPCSEKKQVCVNTQGSYTCLQMAGAKVCPAGFKFEPSLQSCKDVDECAEGIDGCLPETETCRNTDGAYECDIKCQIGFIYSPETGACVDVDECLDGEGVCDEQSGRCVNTIGSYECRKTEKIERTADCPIGYRLANDSRLCNDLDECKELRVPCAEGEICVNTIGSYRCEVVEYEDEIENEEENKAYVYNRSYTEEYSSSTEKVTTEISCPSGYKLDRSTSACEDIDECALGLHTCEENVQLCVNTNGTYMCRQITTTSTTTTIEPLVEPRFNVIQRPTERITRLNRRNQDDYSDEICEPGFRKNSLGKCVDINECLQGPGCRDHERCINTPGGFECSPLCGTGWFFNPTIRGCQDVDECLLGRHNCPQTTHKCENTNGSFNCVIAPPCQSGFRKTHDGDCEDIDECIEGRHNCRPELHQYCVNEEGSYNCLTRLPACPPGYEYSLQKRRCEDIDECLTGNYTCDTRVAETCVNLPGSYKCERPWSPGQRPRQRPACPSGYRYNPSFRRCTDIDECAERLDTCGSEICYNQPGGYSCAKPPTPSPRRPTTPPLPPTANEKCREGTRFVRNRGCVDIDECRELEDACSSNEECINTMGSFECNCKIGFRRDNLTQACVDINECQLREDACLDSQRCDNTIGSYTCVRFLPCGTGYTLNAATEICEDDDECALGTHDCGEGYHCRNTLGSYRCDRNSKWGGQSTRLTMSTSTTTTTMKPTPMSRLGEDTETNCPRGFEPGAAGTCKDIDECARTPNVCGRQRCLNTIGSYRCMSRVICGSGYKLDPESGYCVDVDECAEGTHECGVGQRCENRQGGYFCECPPGHVVSPNNECIDIDECSIHGDRICGTNGRCENTVGAYRCICDSGFEKVDTPTGTFCKDIDECQRTPGLCQHTCLNVWGGYKCGCEPGFRLNSDNRSCSDVNECEEFKDNNLCIGICENMPGSYGCKCPEGYRLGEDGRTCQDIDECAAGPVCRSVDDTCQNTRGSYRCNKIECPAGYIRDNDKKNRCIRASRYCHPTDLSCQRSPSHYSYNFITFVSMLPMPRSGQLELFTMRGSHLPGSTIQFTMALMDARAPPGVARATESCFDLKRPWPSQAVLVMTRSIPGPQEIELDLTMEIYHNSIFAGSAVAKIFIIVSQYEF